MDEAIASGAYPCLDLTKKKNEFSTDAAIQWDVRVEVDGDMLGNI